MSTRKDRVKEKRAAQAALRQKKAEAVDLPPATPLTEEEKKELKSKLTAAEQQGKILRQDLHQWIRANTVGGDVEFTGSHFKGQNSTLLNQIYRQKQTRLHQVNGQIETYQDRLNPEIKLCLKRAAVIAQLSNDEALSCQRLRMALARNDREGIERELQLRHKRVFPEWLEVVERRAVAPLICPESFFRCYHRQNQEHKACDCSRDGSDREHSRVHTLSPRAQELNANCKLMILPAIETLQKFMIQRMKALGLQNLPNPMGWGMLGLQSSPSDRSE